jgi:hypothetical protein
MKNLILYFSLSMLLGLTNTDLFAQTGDTPPVGINNISQVNLSNGAVSESIPIFTVQNGDLSLPISIYYSTSGILAQENPDVLGMSWRLSAGASIVQKVNDKNDIGGDGIGAYYGCISGSFLNEADSQNDIFYYNIGGYSGSFIWDCINYPNGKFVETSGDPLIIEYKDWDITPVGATIFFPNFTITTPEGIIYTFKSMSYYSFTGIDDYDGTNYVWNVTQVKSKLTGKEINITYNKVVDYNNTVSTKDFLYQMSPACSCDPSILPNSGLYFGTDNNANFTKYTDLVSCIKTDRQTISFQYESTPGLKSHKLNKILISDNLESKTLLGYHFSYTKYGQRDFLTKLYEYVPTQIGDGQTQTKPAYVFSYFTPEALPSTSTKATDHWGYYNGATNNSYYHLTGMDKEPHADYTKIGMLQSIKYPEGGTVTYDYEQNKYTMGGIWSYPAWHADAADIPGPGVRVVSKTLTESSGKSVTTNYTYQNGRMNVYPLFKYTYGPFTNTVCKLDYYSEYSLQPSDCKITYEKVTVAETGNGRTEYTFMTTPSITNAKTGLFPFDISVARDDLNGYLTSVSVYDNSSKIKSSTVYTPSASSQTTPVLDLVNYKVLGIEGEGSWNYFTSLAYHIQFYRIITESVTQKVYADNGTDFLQTTTANQYHDYTNPVMKLLTSTTSSSGGRAFVTRYTYPLDYTPGTDAVLDLMKTNQIYTIPVSTETWENKRGSYTLKKGTITQYKSENSRILPYQIYAVETNAPVSSSVIQPDGYKTFSKLIPDNCKYVLQSTSTHDIFGNPVQFESPNANPSSVVWGYKNQYPVADVANARADEVFYDGFEGKSAPTDLGWNTSSAWSFSSDCRTGKQSLFTTSGYFSTALSSSQFQAGRKYIFSAWAKAAVGNAAVELKTNGSSFAVKYNTTSNWELVELPVTLPQIQNNSLELYIEGSNVLFDDVRFYPVDARMSSKTYQPSVGVTSETGPDNLPMFTVYDNFGTVSMVKDFEHKILSRQIINYAVNEMETVEITFNNSTGNLVASSSVPGVTYDWSNSGAYTQVNDSTIKISPIQTVSCTYSVRVKKNNVYSDYKTYYFTIGDEVSASVTDVIFNQTDLSGHQTKDFWVGHTGTGGSVTFSTYYSGTQTDWLSITPKTGYPNDYVITVGDNGNQIRSATIVINYGTATCYISVTQHGKELIIGK